MKIISIIRNAKSDLAIYFKDNLTFQGPVEPRNSVEITKSKSGMPMLIIEFWRSNRVC